MPAEDIYREALEQIAAMPMEGDWTWSSLVCAYSKMAQSALRSADESRSAAHLADVAFGMES